MIPTSMASHNADCRSTFKFRLIGVEPAPPDARDVSAAIQSPVPGESASQGQMWLVRDKIWSQTCQLPCWLSKEPADCFLILAMIDGKQRGLGPSAFSLTSLTSREPKTPYQPEQHQLIRRDLQNDRQQLSCLHSFSHSVRVQDIMCSCKRVSNLSSLVSRPDASSLKIPAAERYMSGKRTQKDRCSDVID